MENRGPVFGRGIRRELGGPRRNWEGAGFGKESGPK